MKDKERDSASLLPFSSYDMASGIKAFGSRWPKRLTSKAFGFSERGYVVAKRRALRSLESACEREASSISQSLSLLIQES